LRSVTILLALLAAMAAPAIATVYTSAQNGDWNSGATWTPAGPPTRNDSVVVNHVVTLTATDSITGVTIGTTGQLVCSGAFSLIVYGNWTNNGRAALTNGFVFLQGATDVVIGGDSATTFWRLRVNKDALARTVTLNRAVTCAYPGAGALAITRGKLITNGQDLTVNATNASVEGDSTGWLAVSGGGTVNIGFLNQQHLRSFTVTGTPTVNITNRHEMYGIYNVTCCSIFGGTVNYTRAGGQNLFLYVTQTGGWWALGGTINFSGDIRGSMLTHFVARAPSVVRFTGATNDTLTMLSASGGHIWSQWRIDDLRVEKTGGALVFLPNLPGYSTDSDSSLFCSTVRVDSGAGFHLGGTQFYGSYRAGYRFGELLNNGAMSQDANLFFLSGSWQGAGSFNPGTGTVTFETAGSDTVVTNGSGFYSLVVKKPAGSLDVIGATAAGTMLLDSAGTVRFTDSLALGTAVLRCYVDVRDRVYFTGTPGDRCVVSAANPAYPFTFSLATGATVGADWADFNNPDSLGINVSAGAFIDTIQNFSNCRFDHGDVPGRMLKVENAQVLTMNGTGFFGTAGANIEKLGATGHITVINGPGTRWGESYDSDPNDLVDWLGPDAGVVAVLEPADTVPLGTVVTPRLRLKNFGSYPATFDVTLTIDDSLGAPAYDTTEAGISLAPGDSVDYAFAKTWTATPRGAYALTAWTASGEPGNDTARSACTVVGFDVGVSAITAPVGVIVPGATVTPAVQITNYGPADALTGVRLQLINAGGTPVYDTTEEDVAVAVGATVTRAFARTWLADPAGRYRVVAWTTLADDVNPANDTGMGSFQVGSGPGSGWTEITQVPLAPSGRAVKDGGWITWDALTQQYYVAKAYKTGDFYSYDPAAGTWTTLPEWPLGVEAKPPYKGANGVSDGNGTIYATKGNNKTGFWKYTTTDSTWTQLTDVPLGLSNKKVKGGTDLVYVQDDTTGWVYLLKGYKCEFYRYNTSAGTWQTLAEAPAGVKPKYDKGSWLLYDEANARVYAHKAKYHELYAYSLDSMSWGPLQPGMPLINNQTGKSKKSKDGGDAVLIEGVAYSLKGGNTIDFYSLDLTTMTWAERETIPSVGSTAKKKRVKGGGSMATDGTVIMALKGSKTAEVWLNSLGGVPARPARSGVMAEPSSPATGVALGPNPLSSGIAVLRYALPKAGPARVAVFDVTGRAVLDLSLALARSGSVDLDLRGLSAGVYLVKLSSGDQTAARKLVVQH
jgi:hypothetical protein